MPPERSNYWLDDSNCALTRDLSKDEKSAFLKRGTETIMNESHHLESSNQQQLSSLASKTSWRLVAVVVTLAAILTAAKFGGESGKAKSQ